MEFFYSPVGVLFTKVSYLDFQTREKRADGQTNGKMCGQMNGKRTDGIDE